MKHIWSVLCKKSVIDSETNNITLNEVLEKITFSFSDKHLIDKNVNFPFDFEVISYFIAAKRDEEGDMEIELLNPDKKTIGKFEQKIKFPKDKMKLRVRVKSPGIVVGKSGEYLFKVKIKDSNENTLKTVAEIPLTIEKKLVINFPKIKLKR